MLDTFIADPEALAALSVTGLVSLGAMMLLAGYVVAKILQARRRKAEIRRLESRFADVVAVAADWVWEINADLRLTFVSDRFFQVTGLAEAQVLGSTPMELRVPGYERDAHWTAVAEWLAAEQPLRDFRFCIEDAGGRRRVLSLSGTPFYDDWGRFQGYRGAGTDMTERLEAEARAQESEQRARQVVDGALDAFVAFDAEGVVVDWNHQADALFGWGREQALGRRLSELIVPEHLRLAHEQMLRRLRGVENQRLMGRLIETEALGKGGGVFPIELTMTATLTRKGRVFNAFVRDITRRRAYEDALREAKEAAEAASRAKSDFLAAMSHELRTPLNAIIGFAELMAVRSELAPERRMEYARDIHESGVHLLGLINEVLDLSKVEAGRMQLDEDSVDVARVCEDGRRLVTERAERAGVGVALDLDPDLPPLLADARRLKQILINLLSNAIRFTDPGGRVTLRARDLGGEGLELQVIDTGIGMEPDQIARALEPFTQLDSGYSRQSEGTGLGLALVQKFAKLHDATVRLDSRPGEGTTATVVFPPARCLDDRSAAPWPAAAQG